MNLTQQAGMLLADLGIERNEGNFETALEVINTHGSYRNAMIASTKIQFKSKAQLLFSLLATKKENTKSEDAEIISSLMHCINKVALKQAHDSMISHYDAMKYLDIRKAFKPTDKQIYVMQELGGRNFIMKINEQEPNALLRRIISISDKFYEPHNQIAPIMNDMVKRIPQ